MKHKNDSSSKRRREGKPGNKETGGNGQNSEPNKKNRRGAEAGNGERPSSPRTPPTWGGGLMTQDQIKNSEKPARAYPQPKMQEAEGAIEEWFRRKGG